MIFIGEKTLVALAERIHFLNMQQNVPRSKLLPKAREIQLESRALRTFLGDVFPQIDGRIDILEVLSMGCVMRLNTGVADLRPGGTVSGPSMFMLADCAFYAATLAMIGPKPLTVTTSCTINFLRKPSAVDLVATARILKLGRLLSVGDVLICETEKTEPVAQASLTYAIPLK